MDVARTSHANYHDANIDKQHFAKRKPMIQARNATIKRLTRNTSQQTVELLSANHASNYIELTSLEQKIRSTGAKSKRLHLSTCIHVHVVRLCLTIPFCLVQAELETT